MKTRREHGFTIYELLITMLIVGIVLAIGVPNMSAFTSNSRITTTVNDLHSSFQLARSEAARAKTNVTICASLTPMAATAICDGLSFDDGWIIFFDPNNPVSVVERDLAAAPPNSENVLRRHPAVHETINITATGSATYFSFAASGLGRGDIGAGPAFTTAVLCDDRGNVLAAGGSSSARLLVVTPIGRASVVRDVDVITAKGGCP